MINRTFTSDTPGVSDGNLLVTFQPDLGTVPQAATAISRLNW